MPVNCAINLMMSRMNGIQQARNVIDLLRLLYMLPTDHFYKVLPLEEFWFLATS